MQKIFLFLQTWFHVPIFSGKVRDFATLLDTIYFNIQFKAEVSEQENLASAIQRANQLLSGERDPNSSEQRT